MSWAIIITRIVGIVHCNPLYKSPEAPCFVAELNISENKSHTFPKQNSALDKLLEYTTWMY